VEQGSQVPVGSIEETSLSTARCLERMHRLRSHASQELHSENKQEEPALLGRISATLPFAGSKLGWISLVCLQWPCATRRATPRTMAGMNNDPMYFMIILQNKLFHYMSTLHHHRRCQLSRRTSILITLRQHIIVSSSEK
jgi:hypothetical protein